MQKIREILESWSRATNKEMMLCCATCGLSTIYMCITDCLDEDIDTRYRKKIGAHVDEMNTRYRPYGIRWDMNFIPFSGNYLSYET
jgi:hypothetical protein